MEKIYDILKKMLTIGNAGVGKTALMERFALDKFSDSYRGVIGVDFMTKIVEIEGTKIKLQMWDTAGQERFRTIVSSYYRNSDGIIIMFDICDKDSLEAVEKWYNEAKTNITKDTSFIMVGGKADLSQERKVKENEAMEIANKLGIPYIEVSAKTGFNVSECYNLLIRKMLESQKEKIVSAPPSEKEEKKVDYEKELKGANSKLAAISEIMKILGTNGTLLSDEIQKVLNAPSDKTYKVDSSGKVTLD